MHRTTSTKHDRNSTHTQNRHTQWIASVIPVKKLSIFGVLPKCTKRRFRGKEKERKNRNWKILTNSNSFFLSVEFFFCYCSPALLSFFLRATEPLLLPMWFFFLSWFDVLQRIPFAFSSRFCVVASTTFDHF